MKLKLSRPKNHEKKHFHFKSSTNLTNHPHFKTQNTAEDDYQLGKIITQKKYYQSLIKKELDQLERLQQPQTQAFNNIQDDYGMIKETIKLRNSRNSKENMNNYKLKNRYADIQSFDSCQNFKSQSEAIEPKTDEEFINCYKILAKFMLEKQFHEFKEKMQQNLIIIKKQKGAKYFNQIRIMKQNFNKFKQNYIECIQQNRLFFQSKIKKVKQILKQSSIQCFIYSSNYQNVKKSYQKLKIFKELDQKRRFLLNLSQNCKYKQKTLKITQKLTQMKVKQFYQLLKNNKTSEVSLKDKQQVVFNIKMHRNIQSFIQIMKTRKILALLKQYQFEQNIFQSQKQKIALCQQQLFQNQKLFPQTEQERTQLKFQKFLQYATTKFMNNNISSSKKTINQNQNKNYLQPLSQNNNSIINTNETNIIYDIYQQQNLIFNRLKLNKIQKKYEKELKVDTIRHLFKRHDLYKKQEQLRLSVIRDSFLIFKQNLNNNKKVKVLQDQRQIQNSKKQQNLKSFLKIISGQYFLISMVKNKKQCIFMKRQEKLQIFLLGQKIEEKLQNQINSQSKIEYNKEQNKSMNNNKASQSKLKNKYQQQKQLQKQTPLQDFDNKQQQNNLAISIIQPNNLAISIISKKQLKLQQKFLKRLFFQKLRSNKILMQKQKFCSQIYNKIYQNQLTRRVFTSWRKALLLLSKQKQEQNDQSVQQKQQNYQNLKLFIQSQQQCKQQSKSQQQCQQQSKNPSCLHLQINQPQFQSKDASVSFNALQNSKSSVQFQQQQKQVLNQQKQQQKQNVLQSSINQCQLDESVITFKQCQNIQQSQDQEDYIQVDGIDNEEVQVDNIDNEEVRLIRSILIKNNMKTIIKNFRNKNSNYKNIKENQNSLITYLILKNKTFMIKFLQIKRKFNLIKKQMQKEKQKQKKDILMKLATIMIQNRHKKEKQMLKCVIQNWKMLLQNQEQEQQQQLVHQQLYQEQAKKQQKQKKNQQLLQHETEYFEQQEKDHDNSKDNYSKDSNSENDDHNRKDDNQNDEQSEQHQLVCSQQDYKSQKIRQQQELSDQQLQSSSQNSQNILQNYIQNNQHTKTNPKLKLKNQINNQQIIYYQQEVQPHNLQLQLQKQQQHQHSNQSSFQNNQSSFQNNHHSQSIKQLQVNQKHNQREFGLDYDNQNDQLQYNQNDQLQYNQNNQYNQLDQLDYQYQQSKEQTKLKINLLNQHFYKQNMQHFIFVIKNNFLAQKHRKNIIQQVITCLTQNIKQNNQKHQIKKLQVYANNKYIQKITKKTFKVFKYQLYKAEEQRQLQIKRKVFLQFKQYFIQKKMLKKYLTQYEEANNSIIDKNVSYYPKSIEDKENFQHLYHNNNKGQSSVKVVHI